MSLMRSETDRVLVAAGTEPDSRSVSGGGKTAAVCATDRVQPCSAKPFATQGGAEGRCPCRPSPAAFRRRGAKSLASLLHSEDNDHLPFLLKTFFLGDGTLSGPSTI